MICSKAASAYSIKNRGGIKPGNYADLVFIKKASPVHKKIITKTGYNPFKQFRSEWLVEKVLVNGIIKYDQNSFISDVNGKEV